MAKTFEFEGPDGRTHAIEGPDDATPKQAFEMLSQHMGAAQEAQSEPSYGAGVARSVAQGITFGFGDEVEAGLRTLGGFSGDYGETVKGIRDEQKRFEEANPKTAIAAEVAGSLPTLLIPGMGAARAVKAGETLAAAGAKAGAKIGAASGAAYGAGKADTDPNASISDALINRAEGAVIGGLGGAALGGAGGAVAGKIADKAATPRLNANRATSADDLKAASSASYDNAYSKDVIFTSDIGKRLGGDVRSLLANEGYMPELQPKIGSVLSAIDNVSNGNVTMKGMENLRKIVGNVASGTDPAEKRLALMIRDKIDDAVEAPLSGEVLTGNSDEAIASIKKGRELWQRARKTEMIDEAIGNAELRSKVTGSGGNIDNAIRQKIGGILMGKKASMFNQAEQELMRQVAEGTTSQNALRLVGKLSPEGNGLSMMLNLGGMLHSGGATAPASITGFIAKRMADRKTLKSADNLLGAVSNGGVQKSFATWQKAVNSFRDGNLAEPTLRVATMQLARTIAKETGEDKDEIDNALMGEQ